MVVFVGDLHIGTKQFSIDFFRAVQLRFFKELLIPRMLKEGIDTIVQFGDFLDNRTSMDIRLWNIVKKELFDDVIVKNNIKIITLLGNHDIAYKNTLDTNFMETIADVYGDNITLIDTPTHIDLCGKRCLVLPWLVDNKIDDSLLINTDVIFGHFETVGFNMIKGHVCRKGITADAFKGIDVFSGHFHIKSKSKNVTYLGTPYQLNYGDYGLKNGFYLWDGVKAKFIENNISGKHIKLKYNNEMIISGLTNKDIIVPTPKEFNIDELRKHRIKFFINKSDGEHETFINYLNKHNITFDIVNNQDISNLINGDFIGDDTDVIDTKEYIINSIDSDYEKDILINLIKEIENEDRI